MPCPSAAPVSNTTLRHSRSRRSSIRRLARSRVSSAHLLAALDQALRTRVDRAALLHHSDRGSQYASREYRAVLEREGIACSMSRSGDCWDNAVAESFFGTLKQELVKGREYETRAEARRELEEYVAGF